MNDVIMWIIIGVVGAVFLGFVIYTIVKICKLSKEERRELIVTYLKGIIAKAEQEVTKSGAGAEKLKLVEEYFEQKAPWFLKILLTITGKQHLDEMIEEGLLQLKISFGKEKSVQENVREENKDTEAQNAENDK